MNRYKLIIFDADGTLTPLRGSPTNPFTFKTLPLVREKCAQLRAQGVTLAIASNQSAHRPVDDIVQQLTWTAKAIGIHDLDILHLMWATGNTRKPSPYMLLELAKHYNIPLNEVLFVGDWKTDQQAASAAGIDFIWADEFFSPSQ